MAKHGNMNQTEALIFNYFSLSQFSGKMIKFKVHLET
jgi:hypothetical protein